MAMFNLSGYNLGELKGLQHEIKFAIKARQNQEIKDAREQIHAIAQKAGISIEELVGTRQKIQKHKTKRQLIPKYRNPANTSQTWAGRGLKPKWLVEGLAGGKALDDFRVHAG